MSTVAHPPMGLLAVGVVVGALLDVDRLGATWIGHALVQPDRTYHPARQLGSSVPHARVKTSYAGVDEEESECRRSH